MFSYEITSRSSDAINRNILQNTTLTNGKTYKLTFKVYTTESGQSGGSDATSSTKGIGAVYKVGSTWKAIGTTGSEIEAFKADQWNDYSYTFTMSEDATIVGLKFRKVTGVFYIDDVTLTETPTITITSTDITSGSTTSTDPINFLGIFPPTILSTNLKPSSLIKGVTFKAHSPN